MMIASPLLDISSLPNDPLVLSVLRAEICLVRSEMLGEQIEEKRARLERIEARFAERPAVERERARYDHWRRTMRLRLSLGALLLSRHEWLDMAEQATRDAARVRARA